MLIMEHDIKIPLNTSLLDNNILVPIKSRQFFSSNIFRTEVTGALPMQLFMQNIEVVFFFCSLLSQYIGAVDFQNIGVPQAFIQNFGDEK